MNRSCVVRPCGWRAAGLTEWEKDDDTARVTREMVVEEEQQVLREVRVDEERLERRREWNREQRRKEAERLAREQRRKEAERLAREKEEVRGRSGTRPRWAREALQFFRKPFENPRKKATPEPITDLIPNRPTPTTDRSRRRRGRNLRTSAMEYEEEISQRAYRRLYRRRKHETCSFDDRQEELERKYTSRSRSVSRCRDRSDKYNEAEECIPSRVEAEVPRSDCGEEETVAAHVYTAQPQQVFHPPAGCFKKVTTLSYALAARDPPKGDDLHGALVPDES
eukprot:TRINITY_DN14532_c0_g1_i1.p1 TRINITY_DN14532_c0_g1~~TRINITY_DN14532_c0_g1_i1.p1  ORF type:complete len:293 (+),score=50.65 TRINITY_DN14532_c0_g1_i1:39-881(+)